MDIAGPACYSLYESAEVPKLISEEASVGDSASTASDGMDFDFPG